MEGLTGVEKVDRLPILVSSNGLDHLLVVPNFTDGTGQAICDVIIQTTDEWNLKGDIKAFSFDTTAVNTGRLNGVCELLESKLNNYFVFILSSSYPQNNARYGLYNMHGAILISRYITVQKIQAVLADC